MTRDTATSDQGRFILQPPEQRQSQATTRLLVEWFAGRRWQRDPIDGSILERVWSVISPLFSEVEFDLPLFAAGIVRNWPILLGGPAHWTVGLIATLISFACIIAADVGAYFGGKVRPLFRRFTSSVLLQ